jgi:hypothetical protein
LPATYDDVTTQQQTAILASITAANVATTVFPDGSTFTWAGLQPGTYAAVFYDMITVANLPPAVAALRASYATLSTSNSPTAQAQLLGLIKGAEATGFPLFAETVIGWGIAQAMVLENAYGYIGVSAFNQPLGRFTTLPLPSGAILVTPVPYIAPAPATPPVVATNIVTLGAQITENLPYVAAPGTVGAIYLYPPGMSDYNAPANPVTAQGWVLLKWTGNTGLMGIQQSGLMIVEVPAATTGGQS